MTYILTKYLILNPKNKFNWIKFMGAGVTFDLNFFDNSKLIEFDNQKVSFLRKKFYSIEREREREREREPNLT